MSGLPPESGRRYHNSLNQEAKMFCLKIIRLSKTTGPFFLLSMLFLSAILEAQHREGPGSRARDPEMNLALREKQQEEKYFEKLCEYLELDKKQKKAAGKLFKKMQKKTEKLAKDMFKGKLSRDEAGERRMKIYRDYRNKFRDLLSQGQQEKYEKLRETGLNTGE